MTAREHLSQAKHLDMRINAKIQQADTLKAMALSVTSVLTDMPHNPNKGNSKVASAVDKLIDLQREINAEIDKLVDLKAEIVAALAKLDKEEYQLLLEKRYLCFNTWDQIASEMGYSLHYLFKLHRRALKDYGAVLKLDT